MATFYPRTWAPNVNDLIYKSSSYGGYNPCLIRDYSNGFVLPNCVGYAWGRYCECQGLTWCNLSTGNASTFFSRSDGYSRGYTPKLGAVACWGGGYYGGAGHVAIVEQINPDGTIYLSESNYSGPIFQMRTCDSSMYISDAFYFQGFIYTDIDFDGEEPIDPPEPPDPPDPPITQRKRVIMYLMMKSKIDKKRRNNYGKIYTWK